MTVPSTAGTENVNKAIEVSLAKKIKIRGSLRGAAKNSVTVSAND